MNTFWMLFVNSRIPEITYCILLCDFACPVFYPFITFDQFACWYFSYFEQLLYFLFMLSYKCIIICRKKLDYVESVFYLHQFSSDINVLNFIALISYSLNNPFSLSKKTKNLNCTNPPSIVRNNL